VEGGSANDYDYVAGDPVNNFDLAGTFCMTGVAKHVQERNWNSKKRRWDTKTREICRSMARGVARNAAGAAHWAWRNKVRIVGAAIGAYMGWRIGAGLGFWGAAMTGQLWLIGVGPWIGAFAGGAFGWYLPGLTKGFLPWL